MTLLKAFSLWLIVSALVSLAVVLATDKLEYAWMSWAAALILGAPVVVRAK